MIGFVCKSCGVEYTPTSNGYKTVLVDKQAMDCSVCKNPLVLIPEPEVIPNDAIMKKLEDIAHTLGKVLSIIVDKKFPMFILKDGQVSLHNPGIIADVMVGGLMKAHDEIIKELPFMTVDSVAKVCHEANKAYCETIGDNSQPEWIDAPDWQKKSAIEGVRFTIYNPDSPPSASHESWLKVKKQEGWKYGEVKDPEKKEHPCFVPYDELPVAQKLKDYIFQGIVKSLIPFVNEGVGASK